jgi:enamine deaminase RidA (YjgF/YER057c/UK114 family)
MTLAQQSNKNMITRVRGRYLGRNASSAYKDLVWAVGTAKDTTVGIEEQTTQTLAALDNLLQEQGSHRSQIASAQVYLTNMANKSAMDRIWCDWLGDDPQHWPQRVCIGVDLHGDMLIEISVTAVRLED